MKKKSGSKANPLVQSGLVVGLIIITQAIFYQSYLSNGGKITSYTKSIIPATKLAFTNTEIYYKALLNYYLNGDEIKAPYAFSEGK